MPSPNNQEILVTHVGPSVPAADVELALGRYRDLVTGGLRRALADARAATYPAPASEDLLAAFHGQVEYHLGWRDRDLTPTAAHPGKLLRPTLVLLAAELGVGRQGANAPGRRAAAERALPAAVCVELIHNFSLIHDDIEDGDAERRHRPTLWKIWGMPQAINTGDGLFAMARSSLWRLADSGTEARTIVRLAELVDRTCLELCEGQFLDMSYEGRQDVTVAMYMDMIGRKTAALMACSTEMGAILGAPELPEIAEALGRFGRKLGVAFQLRDDLLGIWSAEQLGKDVAGDIRRKKMSLPVIHALDVATDAERETLRAIYAAPGAATEEQIAATLGVLERTEARGRVRQALREEARDARAALDAAGGDAPGAREARDLFAALLGFVTAVAD
jgi:geranylgeranyl diphosphate synthase, type I